MWFGIGAKSLPLNPSGMSPILFFSSWSNFRISAEIYVLRSLISVICRDIGSDGGRRHSVVCVLCKFECLKALFLEKNFLQTLAVKVSLPSTGFACPVCKEYLEYVHIYNFDVLIAVGKQVKKREIGKQLTTKMTGWLKGQQKKHDRNRPENKPEEKKRCSLPTKKQHEKGRAKARAEKLVMQ